MRIGIRKERQGTLKLKGIDGKRTEKMCNIGKNKQITTRSNIIKNVRNN